MKIYSSLGSNPYKWDSDRGHFSVCETWRRKFTFFVAVFHTFAHLCFLLWGLVQHSQENEPSFPTAVWLWIWIIGIWLLVTFYNGWTKKWEVVALFKGVKLLTGRLEREYPAIKMKSILWKFNSVDVHFIAVIWICFTYIVAVSTMFFVVPTRSQYFYSLVATDKSDKIDVAFIMFLGFEVYAKTSQSFMMAMESFSIFPTLPPTSFWLNTLTRVCPQISVCGKIAIFQKFQILTTYYNQASIWLLAPVLCVFIPAGLVISCALASIRFHSFLPFFEYLPLPILSNNGVVILAVTLLPSAAIYEASNKLCTKLRAEGKPEKVLRRRLVALHPFGVRIGSISKIRKIAILLSYNFVANYIFTLLITFPAEKVTR
ncbi:hypothetical protein Fcan01_11737 [Folsomia candida]|uniref:Uncharacterized protein n=1 Tax=Folsomia candida TaxID=158441 RepID=A0A226EAT5_FOLCA|nr:hypothetical protein Fcan01_11737 [Folsomia candida]